MLAIHIGSGTGMKLQDTAAPIEIMIHATPVSLFGCASELVWSKFLRKYPGLKIALSEGGIGWIPYFLERADYVYKHHRFWTHQDFGKQLPSDVFREHIITCFIDDAAGIESRAPHRHRHDHLGVRLPALRHDLAAGARRRWRRSLVGVPDAEVRKITYENACRHFRFDPFAHRAKERCTVGALRAEATHVDLAESRAAASRRAEGRALRDDRPRDAAARQRLRDAVRERARRRSAGADEAKKRWDRTSVGSGATPGGANRSRSVLRRRRGLVPDRRRPGALLDRLRDARVAAGLEAGGRAGGAVDAGAQAHAALPAAARVLDDARVPERGLRRVEVGVAPDARTAGAAPAPRGVQCARSTSAPFAASPATSKTLLARDAVLDPELHDLDALERRARMPGDARRRRAPRPRSAGAPLRRRRRRQHAAHRHAARVARRREVAARAEVRPGSPSRRRSARRCADRWSRRPRAGASRRRARRASSPRPTAPRGRPD